MGLEIEGDKKYGRAKILRNTVKPKCRCNVLHSKSEEGGGKDTIKVACIFSLTKAFTRRQLGRVIKKDQGSVFSVFSYLYHRKAPRAIGTQSQGSTVVATNNGSCMPAYSILTEFAGIHVFANEQAGFQQTRGEFPQ